MMNCIDRNHTLHTGIGRGVERSIRVEVDSNRSLPFFILSFPSSSLNFQYRLTDISTWKSPLCDISSTIADRSTPTIEVSGVQTQPSFLIYHNKPFAIAAIDSCNVHTFLLCFQLPSPLKISPAHKQLKSVKTTSQ